MTAAQRIWREQPPPLPQGVARAWFAWEKKQVWCGIFELILGGVFMLIYQKKGDEKVTNERFPSFNLAQYRAVEMLDTGNLLPRASSPINRLDKH